MASRHLARSIVLQSLYEWDFYQKKFDLDKIVKRNIEKFGGNFDEKSFVQTLAEGVVKKIEKIDKIIQTSAPERPIEQLSAVDRNVLRIGLFELLFGNKKEVPPKVAINEAIELAKSFGGESSGRFVNGVLGTVYKEIEKPEEEVRESEKEIPEEILSGGIVYRRKNNNYQIALVYDIFGYWTFPKGHVEKGEDLEEALLREIKEEIGLEKLKIIKKLGERKYRAKEPQKGLVRRKVTDFLLESTDDTELKVEESPGIKDAKWFDLDEIPSLKQYREIKGTLQTVIDYLKQK